MGIILGKAAQLAQQGIYKLATDDVQVVVAEKQPEPAIEDKPVPKVNNDGQNHKCDECGFVSKSKIGLIGHSKKHAKEEK